MKEFFSYIGCLVIPFYQLLTSFQALLAHGALVNVAGHGGVRPLHEAMENGHAELTRLLLSYGADPTLSTYSGQRPSDLTTDSVCQLLLQQHLRDITGLAGSPWDFNGPVRFFGKNLCSLCWYLLLCEKKFTEYWLESDIAVLSCRSCRTRT